MADLMRKILTVERDGDDGLVVTFSDGTRAGYVIEELLALRPHREPIKFGLGQAVANPLALNLPFLPKPNESRAPVSNRAHNRQGSP